jgi:hypothetical protein
MSQWTVHVIDGFDQRLTTPESDYLILDWHWEAEALVADIDSTCFLIASKHGTAHSFLLEQVGGERKIHAQWHWSAPLWKGDHVYMNDIRVEGDLVWLIKEYLPLKGLG